MVKWRSELGLVHLLHGIYDIYIYNICDISDMVTNNAA